MEVYLNGKFIPYEQALVPVEDRGYVFADGIYEVVRFYQGKPFDLEPHMARLQRSASAIRLPLPPVEELTAAGLQTAARNKVGDATLYIQVTRGTAPRKHPFPPDAQPTVYMIARPFPRYTEDAVRKGVTCITTPDVRWHLCFIKSIGLLPNVMAKQQAVEAGAYEAIFVRDGIVTEGSSSNFFIVRGDTLITHPTDNYILGGITRDFVLRLARQLGIPVREERFPVAVMAAANEAFVTSTTSEVMPVVSIDGVAVGDGKPGPVTMRLWEAYDQAVKALQ